MKSYNNTIGNQTHDHPACSAVSKPNAPPRAPTHLSEKDPPLLIE